jgi:hypothetical protein
MSKMIYKPGKTIGYMLDAESAVKLLKSDDWLDKPSEPVKNVVQMSESAIKNEIAKAEAIEVEPEPKPVKKKATKKKATKKKVVKDA